MSDRFTGVYKFLLKVLVLAAIPLLPFIVFYIWSDPYKVLRHHDDYFGNGLGVNKGVVSLDSFLRGKEKYNYNSFILGASISCYYPIEEWKKYLPENAVPFHFDSSGQTVHHTRMFLEFLDLNCDSINNLLIVLNPHVLSIHYDEQSLAGVIPCEVTGGGLKGLLDFHYLFFRRLNTYGYYASLLPWLIDGTKNNLVGGQHIFEPQPIAYDSAINEETIPQWDMAIESDSAAFYADHIIVLPEAEQAYAVLPDRIDAQMKEDFERIADIVNHRQCDLRIVFSPTLALELLSENDDRFLRETFGDKYYNLTAEFREELNDRKNFYDDTHYRPVLAKKYLHRIYSR